MAIKHLEVSGIRNLQSVSLEPSQKFNVIVGPNGSGKTSILEAIHLLGLGRSFRTNKLKRLITDGNKTGTVFGLIENFRQVYRAGIMKQLDGTSQIKINGEPQKNAAELARILPLQTLHPESVVLVDAGPKIRRQYLDWGVFHVEHEFLDLWRSVQKVLKQRNSVLRNGKISTSEIVVWDKQLAVLGERISGHRERYFKQLEPVFTELQEKYGKGMQNALGYYKGWGEDSYADALKHALKRDQDRGFTTCGPHKADIRIKHSSGAYASEVLSRGQKKLLVTLLKLSQTKLHLERADEDCVVMIDDLPSEMDMEAREMVCKLLGEFDCQVFLTCIQPEAIMPLLEGEDVKVFHVEHGCCTEAP